MTIPASGPVTFTDIQTEFGGTNPIALNEYYAGGGLVPAGTTGTYGAVPSSGQISVQNFYGTTAFTPVYIEDVFSTYLYTGNTTAQTITNGIDLAGKGGMVWLKSRTSAAVNNLWDTARTPYYYLVSNDTVAQQSVGSSNALTAYNADGFTVTGGSNAWNGSQNYTSWTFRKQPKFFDVVTWTGDDVIGRQIPHNLGSVPGCIMVKQTNNTRDWIVYHTSLGNTKYIGLNSSSPAGTQSFFNNTTPTSTNFTVGDWGAVNGGGNTYVAYLFASNAGGFGATGTDNVITCGTVTGTGTSQNINLGYEPQWLLLKKSNDVGDWILIDNMRAFSVYDSTNYQNIRDLFPNLTSGEVVDGGKLQPTATGFSDNGWLSSVPYIYIAIRRGPMKVPTDATKVFSPVARTGTGATAQITGIGFTPDFIIGKPRTNYNVGTAEFDRLRGTIKYLAPSWTDAEITDTTMVTSFNMDGVSLGADTTQKYFNGSSGTYINWIFKRAPGFFDEVCYTGNGVNAQTYAHNLTVTPELIIIKARNSARNWPMYVNGLGTGLYFNLTGSGYGTRFTSVSSTTFGVTNDETTNFNTYTYVAYLFATLAGVSKVGSYTGNGTTQTINCGFTGGARFVLIKRTDSTGDWYVYDTARGMTTLTDPYLQINNANLEGATLGSVTTVSTGFAVNGAILAEINTSGASYIFLAIA